MYWLMLLGVALSLVLVRRYYQPADEVYGLAMQSAGILSALWGFAIAPLAAQLALTALALGWLQLNSLRL